MKEAEEVSDSEEEFETVLYKGPNQPYVIEHNPTACLPEKAKHQQMEARLAQSSEQRLSPGFFQDHSSTTNDGESSEIPPCSRPSTNHSSCYPNASQAMDKPFSYPKTSIIKEDNSDDNTSGYNLGEILERVEILDDNDYNEDEWIEWPKKYIEQKGFRLGIQPGDFYKNEFRPCFYVKVPHRSNYEILVTNNNQVPCDLDLYVNGQLTNCLRLPAGDSKSVDGPTYSKYAFKLFRSAAAPSDKVKEGAQDNGIVKAVFTPQKIGNARLRSISEPLKIKELWNDYEDIISNSNDEKKLRSFTTGEGDNVERSLDMSQVVESVTLLQGKKKKKQYKPAVEMEVDKTKRIVLQLRLIASLTEEEEATEDEIYNIEPPPLPSRRE